MGCEQSTPVAHNGQQSSQHATLSTATGRKETKKKHDLSSNLIVIKKKNFRQDYSLVKQIGEGSVSNIYLVKPQHSSDKKMYALKEIDTQLVKPELMAEMRNEIALMRRITHPNILKIYEVYEDVKSNHVAIVMELCSGGDLNKRAPYSEEEAKKIVAKTLEATNYLDIKFENIMFESSSKDAEINLIDFGLSTKFSKGDRLMDKVGTVYTMSPECIRGNYDSQTDMWSIGVVTYQLLSGTKPFWDDTEQAKAIAKAVVKGEYDFDAPVWKGISPQARDLIRKLLVIDPKERLTAKKALKHPWVADLTKGELRKSLVMKVYQSMESYQHESEFKKLALEALVHRSTTDEIMQMKKAFHAIDVDHDGEITLNEMKHALKKETNCSDDEIKEIFRNIDVDDSGKIDYNEFLAATMEAQGEIHQNQLMDAFRVFDKDGDGSITPDELRQLLGVQADKKYIDRLIMEVDTNNDGIISFDEFEAAIRKTNKDATKQVLDVNPPRKMNKKSKAVVAEEDIGDGDFAC